jgi:predicted ATP-grasp superfamily ATP-dependent carboligase
LDWAIQNHCSLIISAAGISSYEDDSGAGNAGEIALDSQIVYAAASSGSAAKRATEKGFLLLKNGWIGGIPTTLLNEASIAEMDVIVLLVNTVTDVPDFHASAIVSSAVAKIIPRLSCDIESLTLEAQSVESKMKQVRNGRNGAMSIYK